MVPATLQPSSDFSVTGIVYNMMQSDFLLLFLDPEGRPVLWKEAEHFFLAVVVAPSLVVLAHRGAEEDL